MNSAQKPGTKKSSKDNTSYIGYLGCEEDSASIIDIKKEDPNIQKFSIGGAIYYVKKKE